MFGAAPGAKIDERATLGDTTAELTGRAALAWGEPNGIVGATLTVTTGSTVVARYHLGASGAVVARWNLGPIDSPDPAHDGSLCVARFAAGDPPVALVSTTIGGAHCCTTVSAIVPKAGSPAAPDVLAHDFGNYGPVMETDGSSVVLRSADNAFAYEFSSFAGSAPPTQLFALAGGAWSDVTREHPIIVQADAAQHWSEYTAHPPSDGPLGVVAGWAGDECLLDSTKRATAMWTTLEQQAAAGKLASTDGMASGQAFIDALRAFLAKNGYCVVSAS